MKTDDLIEALSLDVTPEVGVRPRLAVAAGIGALVALTLVILWLGFRPDYPQAFAKPMFWTKAAYAALFALAGFWCVERLSRPAGSGRKGLILALAVFGVMAAISLWRWTSATPDARMPLLMGHSWRVCPRNILTLALPMLVVTLIVVRNLAPTRLALAGAAAGLFSGGVAALIYGLHCPESTMPFVAVWYSLGMILPAAIGAALGPWVLRWR